MQLLEELAEPGRDNTKCDSSSGKRLRSGPHPPFVCVERDQPAERLLRQEQATAETEAWRSSALPGTEPAHRPAEGPRRHNPSQLPSTQKDTQR